MIRAWIQRLITSISRWHRVRLAQLESDVAQRPLTRHVREESPTTCNRQLATVGINTPTGRPAVTPETHMSDDFVDKILGEVSSAKPGYDLTTTDTLVKDLTKEQHEKIREVLSTWGSDHHDVNNEKGDLFDFDTAMTLGPFETTMVLPAVEPMIRAFPILGKVIIDKIDVAKDLNIAMITIGLHIGEKNSLLPGHALNPGAVIVWGKMVEAMINSSQAAICAIIDSHETSCEDKLATSNFTNYDAYHKQAVKFFGKPDVSAIRGFFRGFGP